MEQKFIDKDGLKVLWNQISLKDYPNNETLMAVIDAIDETKADKENVLFKIEQDLTSEEVKQIHKNLNLENLATAEQVEALYQTLSSDRTLRFYCIEDVSVNLNGIITTYPANSNVEVKFVQNDVWEIIPTSNNSILALNAVISKLADEALNILDRPEVVSYETAYTLMSDFYQQNLFLLINNFVKQKITRIFAVHKFDKV